MLLSVNDICYVFAMRTLIDLPRADLEALGELARRRGVSRASLMRQAIDDYLARQRPAPPHEAFGLWRSADTPEDGLAYQDRIRDEW